MKILCYLTICCFLGLIVSCTKDKIPQQPEPKEEQWKKFVGQYKIYDTTGVYLFDAEIQYYSGVNVYGGITDSIRILNFDNKFILNCFFVNSTDLNYLNFGFHDPIKDYNNKTWGITIIPDDTNTVELENRLVNNRMTLYFRKTNILYWMNESVPYVYENVKHVYVKQP